MRKAVAFGIVAVAALAAAAGGYVYAQHRAAQEMEAALAGFRASLPPGSTLTYASAEPHLFSGSAHLTDITLVSDGRTYTAATADLAPGAGNSLRHLALATVTITEPGGDTKAASLTVDQLALPAQAGPVDPATLRFSHGEVHDLHVTPRSKGTLSAASITVDRYGAGDAGSMQADGLDIQAPPGTAIDHVHLATAHLDGLKLADIVARIESGRGPWPEPDRSNVSLSQFTIGAGGRPLASLASLTTSSAPAAGTRREGTLDLNDLLVQSDSQFTPWLAQLGYGQLHAGLHMHALVDRAAHQLRMDRFDLDAQGMGRLHLAMGLDNIPDGMVNPASQARAPGAVATGILLAQLQALTIGYDDQSLVAKIIGLAATRGGVTPDAVKQAAKQRVAAFAAQANLPAAIIGPVNAFIDDPHRLVITMAPPQPVLLANLAAQLRADPQQSLGLAVTN